MNSILNSIFTALHIKPENGLAVEDSLSDMTTYQRLFFKQVQEKVGVDAVYFLRDSDGIAKIPLIYFSAMDKYDPDEVATLHRLAWNLGEAPLLFIVTPNELKIFNNYKTPRKKDGSLDPKAGLIETIKLADDLESQRQQLVHYNRIQLESGDFWRTSKTRFDSKARIDATLMNNLKIMRSTLIKQIKKRLDEEQQQSVNIVAIVHGLLSRSILIKYLEERKDSNKNSVFPAGFYAQFFDKAECYTDILMSKHATYNLFNCLEEKFNGDMLPLVADELDIVCEDDLRTLRLFLLGDTELTSRQIALWPLYSFDVIPIQLISSIYELFFHLSDNEDDKGTYYTPLHLVDMLMDEVYPWEGTFSPTTFLDPSCGSGIFLVEAYRRLVCRWMRSNNRTAISNNELTELLEKCIFGVDLNGEAVRVASFSLSLAMCDFLDPKSIWDSLSFPGCNV
ncbi:DNA methyltransferase [Phosphitispora fastidiosa]|uniref:DNA methyltransferase n=1 Tax=Phosphitispora fastidiosa TaxID=2837202 RepID=UPI0022B16C74|nr:N-6 DNA methylase [Phosphitispora fastidiosa]MBU7007579.1 type I restriction-modification system DNA methylase subunit [Phosphitispora fastidiosa]